MESKKISEPKKQPSEKGNAVPVISLERHLNKGNQIME